MADLLDAAGVRRWSRFAADALGRTRAEIDALNVFPVPDGDTGTNLHLTVLAASEAVERLPEDADAASAWRALADGALIGARGNSGVILSQILRGLAEILGDGGRPAEALRHASRLADRAVAHPVEGTILSVLRAAADACPDDGAPGAVAWAVAEHARAALKETTGQLDVLARSGVVDAGAAGLCVILETLAAVASEEFPQSYAVPRRTAPQETASCEPGSAPDGGAYEVMFLVDAGDQEITELRAELDRLGDSLVVVGGDGLWNVHVHTDDAGPAIEAAVRAGRPHGIRVTYLQAQVDRHARTAGRGVVAVTLGAGLTVLFEQHGARAVRREAGGLPSPAELTAAIVQAGDEVAVLPGDRAVLAVAEAAAQRAREDGVRVAVIPSRASVQGLAALAVHDPLRRFDDDVIAMTSAAGATRFGRLETAEEEAVTSAGICRAGDTLGLIDDDVAVIGADPADVATRVLERMLSGGGELVTLITGEAAGGLADAVREHLRRPEVEIVVYEGGQERYPLLIGVE
ncbi:DAK2 domain-containing protein [Actinoallomurus iriomotensis]|uniref:Dihydroxyacetone kinase n=1 Tax=Actinoallomurus iriomotensis TaxID=478107 RepID=A0A9W6RYH8_9ACTN|nr:DAK2 domain-containing protein [Actinoallomurus iriomotensis]GLY84139.1 dihydroxyacetone kinase [Actinoallomurus iriomotensis]